MFPYFRGPKKLSNTTNTVVKRKGKKCHTKQENYQASEIIALPIQSRRETRNSAKVAALRKLKENSDDVVEDNKRKLKYIFFIIKIYKLYNIF